VDLIDSEVSRHDPDHPAQQRKHRDTEDARNQADGGHPRVESLDVRWAHRRRIDRQQELLVVFVKHKPALDGWNNLLRNCREFDGSATIIPKLCKPSPRQSDQSPLISFS
jgi:hypothetical protein